MLLWFNLRSFTAESVDTELREVWWERLPPSAGTRRQQLSSAATRKFSSAAMQYKSFQQWHRGAIICSKTKPDAVVSCNSKSFNSCQGKLSSTTKQKLTSKAPIMRKAVKSCTKKAFVMEIRFRETRLHYIYCLSFCLTSTHTHISARTYTRLYPRQQWLDLTLQRLFWWIRSWWSVCWWLTGSPWRGRSRTWPTHVTTHFNLRRSKIRERDRNEKVISELKHVFGFTFVLIQNSEISTKLTL